MQWTLSLSTFHLSHHCLSGKYGASDEPVRHAIHTEVLLILQSSFRLCVNPRNESRLGSEVGVRNATRTPQRTHLSHSEKLTFSFCSFCVFQLNIVCGGSANTNVIVYHFVSEEQLKEILGGLNLRKCMVVLWSAWPEAVPHPTPPPLPAPTTPCDNWDQRRPTLGAVVINLPI